MTGEEKTNNQQVILVDEQDNETGVMDKMQAHRNPVLHRAFSVFIFNGKNEMLLQRRAAGKYHSPGLWTNACCSHPMPAEATEDAAKRRLREEMGIDALLEEIFSFTYKTAFDNGLFEHEYDHVFAGFYEGSIDPDPDEVSDYCFMAVDEIAQRLEQRPEQFTYWFRIAFDKIKEWIGSRKGNNA